MKVCVVGLWHLGTVTAACLASGGHDVTGLDSDPGTITNLSSARAPLFEPGLDELLDAGINAGRLRFTTDPAEALRDAEIVWVTFDTPVDADDRADVDSVRESVEALFPHVKEGALVLISSQVPVGTTRQLEQAAEGRGITFAYSPENLRLGKAIDVFTHPDRVVAGVRSDADRERIARLLAPFTDRIEAMSVESAEMTKHALNAFLALSVTFINEIAAICERVGADAKEVERGLKTEKRIGPGAYLGPGGAFAGGTLARDIVFLSELGTKLDLPTHVIAAVKASNDAHRSWAKRRLRDLLGDLRGRHIAVWGLTYKPGTDTLRRSSAIELVESLADQGAVVDAHDPSVRSLPEPLAGRVRLHADARGAAKNADALVVMTEWPQFRDIDGGMVARDLRGKLVLDANRFLAQQFSGVRDLTYVTVGKAV
jgi:UDPglucose 6-dehydrogenase